MHACARSYFGNLHPLVQQASLESLCAYFGPVESAKVIKVRMHCAMHVAVCRGRRLAAPSVVPPPPVIVRGAADWAATQAWGEVR
jgi:hypothetical protein